MRARLALMGSVPAAVLTAPACPSRTQTPQSPDPLSRTCGPSSRKTAGLGRRLVRAGEPAALPRGDPRVWAAGWLLLATLRPFIAANRGCGPPVAAGRLGEAGGSGRRVTAVGVRLRAGGSAEGLSMLIASGTVGLRA